VLPVTVSYQPLVPRNVTFMEWIFVFFIKKGAGAETRCFI
jgi:hypothetical protein